MVRVALSVGEAPDDWEATLIRGALSYCGISCDLHGATGASADECLRVRLGGDAAAFAGSDPADMTVLAGRQVTRQYLSGKLSAGKNQLLIYGEPYAALARLAENPKLCERLKGKSVRGPLLNPSRYARHRVPRDGTHPAKVMVSIGCQKRCAYCSYGSLYSAIYGPAFSRRSRPYEDVLDELRFLITNGCDSFVLIADQVIARNPEDNKELFELARHWKSVSSERPTVFFTTSPFEVSTNRDLITTLHESFRLRPTLSVDSLDDTTLRRFKLGFTSREAMESLEFLAALALPLRLNYIFDRPWATGEGLRQEFSNLRALAEVVSYLAADEQLRLACDLFSRRLEILWGAPIAEECNEASMVASSRAMMSECMKKMAQAIGVEVRTGAAAHPLKHVIEAGWEALMAAGPGR